MQTPLRQLRAYVENRLGRPPLSERQRAREERIIAAAQMVLAGFPDDTFTIGKLAHALRMAPATIHLHFSDAASIAAEILFRHVLDILRAIGKIPHDAPNRGALQRAAYLEATRTPWGGFTDAHFLLLRLRQTLPQDLARPIEEQRQLIGDMLGGEHAETALMLLDAAHLQADQIEDMLAYRIKQGAAAAGAVGWASAQQPDATATPPNETAPPAATDPEPAQAAAPPPYRRHYKNWKAARREKSLMKQAARAARANNST